MHICLFAVYCPVISLSKGKITYDQDRTDDGLYPINTQATANCDRNYRRNGWRVRTCQPSGQWNGTPASCMIGNELNT